MLVALFLDARAIEPQLADDFACAGFRDQATDRDPPADVVAALAARLGKPVYPANQCTRADAGVVVAGARGEGTWLSISALACPEPARCTATVGYYVANMGSGGRDVIAARTSAGWRIIPTGRMWIS